MIKYICFHLPQFHEIEENNKWWGKGFTEWVNVKKAKPLFKNHNQPRVPHKDNYYDLSDINELRAQFDLAKKNDVFGFCFYHYWFKGKQLLEKPVENLLANTDIDGNYCFSWANETWSRTWNGQEKNILMKQEYGDKDDWVKHIKYLINFFKDERYIKVDNKPMFLIYNISRIRDIKEMIEVWNQELKKVGFDEIYLVNTLNSFNHRTYEVAKANVIFEPWYTITRDYKLRIFLKVKKLLRQALLKIISYNKLPKFIMATISYDYLCKKIIKRKIKGDTFLGFFPDWDNSPRKARTGHSTIITGSTPEKFGKYNDDLRKKIEKENLEKYIFINAWNEWGESAALEPDEKYGNAYLKKLKRRIT